MERVSDARIVIEIDYEPNLEHYPADITTKAGAMEFDINQVLDGNVDEAEVLQYADCVDWRVETR